MISTHGPLVIAATDTTSVVISTRSPVPTIVYLGPPLSGAALHDLAAGIDESPPRPKSTLDAAPGPTLCPLPRQGWAGQPGIELARTEPLNLRFAPAEIETDETTLRLRCQDTAARIELCIEVAARSSTIGMRLAVTNLGSRPVDVERLAVTVPLPDSLQEITTLTGWWSHEFGPVRHHLDTGSFGWANRKGRTSHDRVPAIWVGEPGFDSGRGEVLAATLAWSGNTSLEVDRLGSGVRVLQAGEILDRPGVRIGAAETCSTPWLELAHSTSGTNATSQALHRKVRQSGPANTRLPVYLNTWEAVYFDHDLKVLLTLAEEAARVGVERFVLDDGWFHGRRHDRAGLGDWWVDPEVWPDGLGPLVDHVLDLGMEFGIWVEPEMISRDSDLYRNHPDWVYGADSDTPGTPLIEGRNQLPLDLTRSEVRTYLLEKLDTLLASHPVRYIKWDMNRDVLAGTGNAAAGSTAHEWTLGLYELVDQLRARHPDVELESCASGGGRADLGILERTMRIWPSDSNDALERQRIQQGFSMLFPPEVMGSHVGPPISHTSGRFHSISFRLATAFMGSFGIEWNILGATAHEFDQLAAAIRAYKQHRHILIGGTVWRLETGDPTTVSRLVVSPGQSEALWSFACLDQGQRPVPNRLRLAGLDADARYLVKLIDLGPLPGPVDEQASWFEKGAAELSGAYLAEVGIQPPALNPQSAFVAHLERLVP